MNQVRRWDIPDQGAGEMKEIAGELCNVAGTLDDFKDKTISESEIRQLYYAFAKELKSMMDNSPILAEYRPGRMSYMEIREGQRIEHMIDFRGLKYEA